MLGSFRRFLWAILILLVAVELSNGDDGPKSIREISYPRKFHSKQISENGDSLVIGLKLENGEFGNRDMVVECTKSNQNEYKDKHLIEISNQTTRSYQVLSEKDLKSVSYSNYFVYITKEVWSCKDSTNTDPLLKDKWFMRIVNEVVGVKEMFEIKYYDGIEVTTGYHLLGGARTARLREIKYIDPAFPDKAFRFDGFVKILKPTGRTDFGDFEKDLINIAITTSDNELIKEVTFGDSPTLSTQEVSTDGMILIIGKEWQTPLGDVKQKSICFQEQGVIPFPYEFRPACAQEQQIIGSDKNRLAEISEQDLVEFFVPIREEVWNCMTHEGVNFLRIVNEVVGRQEIKTVKYFEGVTKITSIKNHEGKETVRFTEVKYMDAITKDLLKYDGSVVLIKKEVTLPSVDSIHYNLDANRLYRTLISPKGYDLRIGSRWEGGVVGTKKSQVTCKVIEKFTYSKSYLTKFRVRTKLAKDEITTYRSEYIKNHKKTEYFDYIRKEFYVCHDMLWKLQFIRVVNVFDVLVPVHEIEFYDGIDIFEKVLSEDRKSVRIREIKYLQDNNLDVVKYEGKLVVEKPEGSPDIDLSAYGNPVRRSDADIFWRVGYLSAKKTVLKELNFNPPRNRPDFVFDSGCRTLSASEKYDTTRTIGNPDDYVLCDQEASFEMSAHSKYILSSIGSKPEVLEPSAFRRLFVPITYEKWVCKNPKNQDSSFLRYAYSYTFVNTEESNDQRIGKISFPNDEVSVKVRTEFDKSGYRLKLDDVRYVRQKLYRTTGLPIPGSFESWIFAGDVILDGELKDTKKIDKMSGTEKFLDVKELKTRILHYITQEIEYHDQLDSAYEINLRYTGDKMEIGTKWKREYGDSSMVMECVFDDNINRAIYDTFLRTRVKVNKPDMNNQLIFETYFDDQKTEVWKCKRITVTDHIVTRTSGPTLTEAKTSQSQGFQQVLDNVELLRVVTQFSVKSDQCNAIRTIWHRDGVTVRMGDYTSGRAGCMEIAELKYVDPKNYAVLKFDGKIKLKKGNKYVPKKITALHLINVAKIAVHYLPESDANELLKTDVKPEGLTMEVGSPHELIVRLPKVKCFQAFGTAERKIKESHPPRIMVNQLSSSGSYQPMTMDKDQIKNCFQFTSEIWNCKENEEFKFYRVMNKLVQNPSCPIARIYHYAGVTVNVKPSLYIIENKFINKNTDKIIRYEGFMNLNEVLAKTSDESEWTKESKEFIYELDTPTLFSTKVKDDKGVPLTKGLILEVGSPWKSVFGSADDVVLCERTVDHKFDTKYNTKVVFSTYENNNELNKKAVEMTPEMFKKHFDVLRQEVWDCKKNKLERFLRVVNFIVALGDIAKLYHPYGITLGTQVFPDNTTSTQIKEVKYLHPHDMVPLRYDGEITLETIISKRASRLFQMPSQFQEFFVETSPPGTIDETKVKFWSPDILRVHALRVSKRKDTTKSEGAAVSYTDNNIHLTKIAEGYGVKMKIGSKWEREFKTDGNSMECILDQWNPTNRDQFLTRILMYFDKHLYELDVDTITDNFIIKKIEVWICVNNDDTILRIVTELEGTVGIFVVLHRDGVTVTPTDLFHGQGKTANITEIKYLDPKNFEVLKYTGTVQLMTPKEPEKAEIGIPGWRKVYNYARDIWFDKLRQWAGVQAAFKDLDLDG